MDGNIHNVEQIQLGKILELEANGRKFWTRKIRVFSQGKNNMLEEIDLYSDDPSKLVV